MENRLVVDRGERERDGWEFGVGRCKLLYTEWVHNKVLPYNSRKYVQFTVINHNGKEYFLKMYDIYVYNQVILLYSRN